MQPQFEIRGLQYRNWQVYDLIHNRLLCKCTFQHQAEELLEQLIRLNSQ